ncbi:hypothetical protein [Rhodoplanes sp. Z2-YC6860]|uniref:hypothetical protein n=1 Tax=Rhodoplanes sp. Z2-YC6860 TaxID=674703 RepID=UPI00082A198E|nr:hypothetical protein [Rhodoplanes sp. Z2-YC6860]
MDFRILLGAAVALIVVAFGGFYFAFGSRSNDTAVVQQPPSRTTAANVGGGAPAAGGGTSSQPAAQPPAQPPDASQPTAPSQPAAPQSAASSQPAPQPAAPVPPGKATPESIEAEIARSDHADLQVILKKNFADDYKQLIAMAVERRNEGVSDQQFGQELFGRFQEIMRNKLRYAAGASTPMIDRLAENEVSLFHALGTEGAPFCLKVLGKDETPADGPPPDSVRRMMRLGTLYRFQAIVEGLQNSKPIDPLTNDELTSFETSLNRDGLKFDDVRSGSFLTKGGDGPGKPCLMIEKLYQAIARLNEGTRRKIYAGMFFLGRDK